MLKAVKIIAATGVFLAPITSLAQFAQSVVSYQPGINFATEFGTGLGFTNSASALGAPSSVTPGQFGGPVDPFNPPYLREQVVSVGSGGSLTLELSSPAQNSAANPFGIDFIIYGNSGFIITNGDFSGGGITDGSLFAANEFSTRVSVSNDGQTFFALNPLFAPVVDSYYPTDGSGNFFVPVDPSLPPGAFSGQGLSGIRSLYAGSAGGTGYDLSWAVDGNGNSIQLGEVSFVRIDVLSGASEIDALVVVPEPGIWSVVAMGALVLGWFTCRKG